MPANCTDCLQPLDVSVNKAGSYSDKVYQQLEGKKKATAVDLSMPVVKPLSGKWMMGTYDYIKTHPDGGILQ